MNWIAIGTIDDIPLRGARCVKTPQGKIGVFRTADNEVFAIEDHCPHKGGPLTQGIVHGTSVTCPLHNWVISLETGKALARRRRGPHHPDPQYRRPIVDRARGHAAGSGVGRMLSLRTPPLPYRASPPQGGRSGAARVSIPLKTRRPLLCPSRVDGRPARVDLPP